MNWRWFWHSNIDDVLRAQERHDTPWPWPERRPWTCPVCEGSGQVWRQDGVSTGTMPCRACDGSGIVWDEKHE